MTEPTREQIAQDYAKGLTIVDSLRRERDELLAAAKLTALHFKRNQASGNFQGDDEHEAWTALNAAIAKAEGTDD